jgi:hypothetical protein
VDFLSRFADAWRTKYVALNTDLFADDGRLAGVTYTPFEGKEAVLAVFAMLGEVLEELEYVAQFERPRASPDRCLLFCAGRPAERGSGVYECRPRREFSG